MIKTHGTCPQRASSSVAPSFPSGWSTVSEQEANGYMYSLGMCLCSNGWWSWAHNSGVWGSLLQKQGQKGAGGRNRNQLYELANIMMDGYMPIEGINVIEFAQLELLRVILLLILYGIFSYSFLTETLGFHLLDAWMKLSYPKRWFQFLDARKPFHWSKHSCTHLLDLLMGATTLGYVCLYLWK